MFTNSCIFNNRLDPARWVNRLPQRSLLLHQPPPHPTPPLIRLITQYSDQGCLLLLPVKRYKSSIGINHISSRGCFKAHLKTLSLPPQSREDFQISKVKLVNNMIMKILRFTGDPRQCKKPVKTWLFFLSILMHKGS